MMSVVALLNFRTQSCLCQESIFDKIYESKTPVVVDDQESEPNIPVIDLEKEVFDLDSYNCNRTFVTSNVHNSFSSVTTLPIVKI